MSRTPGPWVVHPFRATVDAAGDGEMVPVCGMLWPTGKRTEAETEANARLIAAAPDLADVAHMVLNTATVYTPPELVKAATEALRKAGEKV